VAVALVPEDLEAGGSREQRSGAKAALPAWGGGGCGCSPAEAVGAVRLVQLLGLKSLPLAARGVGCVNVGEEQEEGERREVREAVKGLMTSLCGATSGRAGLGRAGAHAEEEEADAEQAGHEERLRNRGCRGRYRCWFAGEGSGAARCSALKAVRWCQPEVRGLGALVLRRWAWGTSGQRCSCCARGREVFI